MEVLPRAGDRVEVILVRIGKPAVPELEKALQDPDRARPAARVLGGMGERARDAVPALAALLADPKADVEARAEAAKALGLIGSEEKTAAPVIGDPVIAALVIGLSGSSKVQIPSARSLGTCGVAGRPAVAALARLAKDKDADVARAACEALGRIGAPEGALALLSRVQQADAASAAAASALARLGPVARPAVGGLIESLKSEKADAALARATLERLGTTAGHELQDALKRKDAVTRRAAADVLGLMGPRAASSSKALEGMLKHDDPGVVIAAASALLRIEPEQTKPILAAIEPLLTHKDEVVAAAAASVVSDLGPDAGDVVPVLRQQLSSTDEKTVSRAALALGRIRAADGKTVSELSSAATKGPEKARSACVEALGRGGAKESLAVLALLLNDEKRRAHAAVALARVDSKKAADAVEALTSDLLGESEEARKRALAALFKMRPVPREALEPLIALLGRREAVSEVLAVLERMPLNTKDGRLALSLVGLLGTDSAANQARAAAILERIGEPALSPLLLALKSRSPEIRAAVARLLANDAFLGDNRPSPHPLVAVLSDENESVRLAAVQTVATAGGWDESVAKKLLPLLGHNDGAFRRAAARALGSFKSEEIKAPLVECLLDPAEEVRLAAFWSLVRLRAQEADWAADDPSPLVRQARLDSLSSVAFPNRLTEADLRADELEVRLSAARKFADGERPDQALALLIGVLEGWDEPARLAAAETLGELRGKAKPALPALRRRERRDWNEDVRRACAEAIKAIESK
jgi:HEAT repeat protein